MPSGSEPIIGRVAKPIPLVASIKVSHSYYRFLLHQAHALIEIGL
jgi:hypothetical protein